MRGRGFQSMLTFPDRMEIRRTKREERELDLVSYLEDSRARRAAREEREETRIRLAVLLEEEFDREPLDDWIL